MKTEFKINIQIGVLLTVLVGVIAVFFLFLWTLINLA